jgi:hypothetical protein
MILEIPLQPPAPVGTFVTFFHLFSPRISQTSFDKIVIIFTRSWKYREIFNAPKVQSVKKLFYFSPNFCAYTRFFF